MSLAAASIVPPFVTAPFIKRAALVASVPLFVMPLVVVMSPLIVALAPPLIASLSSVPPAKSMFLLLAATAIFVAAS